MKCGDFFSSAEVAALGFDTKHYKEDASQPTAELGLRCRLGSTGFVVVRRSRLNTPDEDAKAAKLAGVSQQVIDGAKVGSDTRWLRVSSLLSLNFVSTNKHFMCTATGPERNSLLKLAQALDAKMNKL